MIPPVDCEFELRGLRFVAVRDKARANITRHGIELEQAAQVFFDPLFRLVDASGEVEAREAAIGYESPAVCSSWCTLRPRARRFASFRPAGPLHRSAKIMIPERIKRRLNKDRPMTSITLRIPQDVVDSLKELAPKRGFSGYQALLKFYIGEGLRADEARFFFGAAQQLADALKRRGVSAEILEEAEREIAGPT